MLRAKRIRPRVDFGRLLHTDLSARGHAIYNGVFGCKQNFPNPPVDKVAFKSELDAFDAAIAGSFDGSKTMIAERDSHREDLIYKMRDLAHYVESCHVDMPTFLLSGFEAIPATRAKSSIIPLLQPYVVKLNQGNSGELLVYIKPVQKARHYELRYSQLGTEGALSGWTSTLLAAARDAVAINNLTPGKIYAFQVRAFGRAGHTDWSDSASRMCI